LGTLAVDLLNGVSYGMVLFLLAAGLSMVMGLMGITNMAHGALYMVGAYVGWTIVVQTGLNFWLGAVIGGVVGGVLGLILERVFLRSLYKRPNEQVLLTWGFVYILTNVSIWIWGGRYRVQFTAPSLSGSLKVGGLSFPIARLVTIGVGLAVAVALWWWQERTRGGAQVRAGMDDKETISGLGVNVARISMIVFFAAAFLAGFAGVVGAQLLGVNSTMGTDILLLALIVIIVGGVGSVQGALLGAILIGLISAFGKHFLPEFDRFTMYLAMIVVLVVRPTGLIGRGVQTDDE
jgi:branched-chain amino acid transport system permease protein